MKNYLENIGMVLLFWFLAALLIYFGYSFTSHQSSTGLEIGLLMMAIGCWLFIWPISYFVKWARGRS